MIVVFFDNFQLKQFSKDLTKYELLNNQKITSLYTEFIELKL